MEVKILADSIYSSNRIVTFHLVYPQTIHQQVLTHRVFSRNSSSMRAISTSRVLNFDLVYPIWTKEKRGMQGEIIQEQEVIEKANWIVRDMFYLIEACCEELIDLSIHHQNINDYLRPFQNIHTVLTSTEWDNWFDLRLDEHSKPEIRLLAQKMLAEMESSQSLSTYNHLPLVTDKERLSLEWNESYLLSAARCARISYLSKTDDIQKDLDLAKKLLANKHLSPFEHAAKAKYGKYANFTNWQSYRNMKGF